jgi:hypothetical protein
VRWPSRHVVKVVKVVMMYGEEFGCEEETQRRGEDVSAMDATAYKADRFVCLSVPKGMDKADWPVDASRDTCLLYNRYSNICTAFFSRVHQHKSRSSQYSIRMIPLRCVISPQYYLVLNSFRDRRSTPELRTNSRTAL